MFQKIALFSFGILFAGSVSSSAQSGLASKAQQFANEVYQDCIEYAGPSYLPGIQQMLARVTIATEPQSAQENYAKLSTLILKNKCNPNLTRDEQNFNPDTFNPLKYFFNFYPDAVTKYRVDGTSYIIVITPQD